MKRRQRRPVLELNKNQPASHAEYFQSPCTQMGNENTDQNVSANPLANLLSHYESDSDGEDTKKDGNKLDDQVNNFLKEIQLIAPKESVMGANNSIQPQQFNHQSCKWRECIDESTGYPYYWHIETNEVTWEMPAELRNLKNASKVSNIQAPTVQEPHWVDFSSISYQQSHENIPEGMIPREVVARNRNRFGSTEPIRHEKETKAQQENANHSEDDSEDGKIEMITSYGSESDSENDNESSPKKLETKAINSNGQQINKLKTTNSISSPRRETLSESKLETSEPSFRAKKKDFKRKSKLRPPQERTEKLLAIAISEKESSQEELKKDSKRYFQSESLDFRVSLVPGYEMDSENEEECEKQERKCLFPIPQDESVETNTFSFRKVPNTLSKLSKADEKSDSNDSSTISEKKNEEKENESSLEKTEEEADVKTEQKVNKFLESLQEPSKCFQRKRRIAFDVPPAKIKVTEEILAPKVEPQVAIDAKEESQECPKVEEEKEEKQDQAESSKSESNEEKASECTKTSEEAPVVIKKEKEAEEDVKAPTEAKDEEVNSLSQIIQEKLKFLSEGKAAVSPVQTMAIQLQTLCAAWEGGYLEKNYLRRWLTETSHELERLEQDAAPPGWLCQWDRSHKRYYYENPSSGLTQWTYPDTGIAGGTEEMEICSTPPPPEQEDIITPVEAEDTKKQPSPPKSKQSKEDGESSQTSEQRPSDIEAPPPPQISNPSPPPPPRIFAEDLKKDKKRNDKEVGGVPETKSLEVPATTSQPLVQATVSPQTPVISSIANTEPLPPGVDLSEAPYEIPATALKRILYNTVQGATLYEAATREPTVPILGHPIVQEHYLQYPYQHLHAPAIVLPHKHGVQPAIQLIPDYTSIYANHKVIEKPPVKTPKESLVSALDSFYSDIARIEKSEQTQHQIQKQEPPPVELAAVPAEEPKLEVEQEPQPAVEAVLKEKKRKKARIGISKKHKEVSSMVAKWQRAQQNLDDST